jgi:outer membrane protein TolC
MAAQNAAVGIAVAAHYPSVSLSASAGFSQSPVENDLSGLRILAQQAQALDVAVRGTERGSQIALAEFHAGTVDYTRLSQETPLADQQSALSVASSTRFP